MCSSAFIPPVPFSSTCWPCGVSSRLRHARPLLSFSRVPHHQRYAVILGSADSPMPSQPMDPMDDAEGGSGLSVSTAVSSAATLNSALADAASRSLANLSPGEPPHLAVIYVSVRYSVSNVGPTGRHSMDLVVPRLRALLPTLKAVIGCTTDGVMGAGRTGDTVEIENAPAVSLTLMRLPGITVTPFHVMPDDLPSLDAKQDKWYGAVGRPDASPVGSPAFLVFSDPTFASRGELDRFLSGVEYAYPGSCVTGALASAGTTYAKGHLFCTLPRDVLSPKATSLRDSGLVGVALTGDVQLDCLVSPGCRPVGPELEVRKVDGPNTILELELVGRPSSCLPATSQLKSILSYATPAEQRLIQDHLHVGVFIDRLAPPEDSVIIRDVIGIDLYGGSISVACDIRVGQRVRFYVMEVEAALEALDKTMQRYKRVELANSLVGYSNPPFGAMVFADVARGRGTFREPLMETRILTSFAAGVPVAGAFSGGQIGPSYANSGPEGKGGPSIMHTAANLITLMRRRSGLSPSESVDSPSTSSADVDKTGED